MAQNNNSFSLQGATPYAQQPGTKVQSPTTANNPAQKAINNALNFSFSSGSPGTVAPIAVKSSGITSSATTPGLSTTNKAPTPNYSGLINSIVNPPQAQAASLPQPVKAPLVDYTAPGGTNQVGTHILTQEELDAQNAQNAQKAQDASQSQTPQNPSVPKAPNTYPGMIDNLVQMSTTPNPQAQAAFERAQEINREIAQSKIQLGGLLANNASNPIPLQFQQGRARIMTDQGLAQQGALASELQGQTNLYGSSLQQQQIAQSGLGSAITAAAPQLASYGQQSFDPLTGSFGGGTNLQDAVKSIAAKVVAGQMSYNDAVSALSGYGQGGVNALQGALPSGFNVAQSNTLAGQQGSVGPAYNFAKTALDNLQTTINNLPGFLQGTNIPGINAVGNFGSWITGLGSEQTRQYQGAVQEARNAYAQLLAASRGGTPTDYSDQAKAAIPDQPTPNDVKAALSNLESLGGAKLQIYGNPGSVNQSNNQSTGGSTANVIQTKYGPIDPTL